MPHTLIKTRFAPNCAPDPGAPIRLRRLPAFPRCRARSGRSQRSALPSPRRRARAARAPPGRRRARALRDAVWEWLWRWGWLKEAASRGLMSAMLAVAY